MGVEFFFQIPTAVIVGWLAGRTVNITIRVGLPACLNYSVIFIVHMYVFIYSIYSQFTNMAAGRVTQPGGPRVGRPCFTISI